MRAIETAPQDLIVGSRHAVLTRGLGRSYGDASLPPASRPEVMSTRAADRILAFDPSTGVLRAEAGLSLRSVNAVFMRRGWFPPVTPGTQYVTLGGMVAADVHGKNHHVDGGFGEHVSRVLLRTGDGHVVECSRQSNPSLFAATLGGMGLTGHILEVEFALRPIPSPWIQHETLRIPDLGAFLEQLSASAAHWPFTVGWIDCLKRGAAMGRGVLIRGRFADASRAPRSSPPEISRLRVPFDAPNVVMRDGVMRTLNAVYYATRGLRPAAGIEHPEKFFYPLDALLDWNRLYGRRGFTQYQCVVPRAAGPDGVERMLRVLTDRGGSSFLCVIKDCGAEGLGTLSFPMPGISIAADLPVRPQTQALVDALNETLIALGGRVYLAKDSFTRAEHFRAMEPRLPRFLAERARWDRERRIRSALSVRLMGDPP
ncbi:MAG: FAD-binding oxidoreductase [Planctomycetes bacterium]|nr:FAD-binding oxidoreductase [Planctomycetota bacterium]MCC7172975.1 FAD-binding oxidoreductase [Planctomycetota bacterium]